MTHHVCFKVIQLTEGCLAFADEPAIDIVILDGNSALHIIYTTTRVSAATFLDSNGETYGKYVDLIWLVFVQTCVTMYTWYLNRLRVDQGPVLTSYRWE